MISEENFLGNEKIRNYLNKALAKERILHAYLFEGPEHLGKTTLALRLASELLEDSFENISKNPDLLTVSADEDKGQISVEKIRDLQKDLSLYPFRAKYKVAIIEKSEKMNHTAANSLLKTLEEPGKTSIIILVSDNSQKILNTIKSRCQSFSFNTVGKEKLRDFLEKKSLDASPEIIELSQGKPGLAINLAQNKEIIKAMEEERGQISRLLRSDNVSKLEEAALIASKEKEEIAGIFDSWILTLRADLRKKVAEKNAAGTDFSELKRIKDAITRISETRKGIIEDNLNLRLSIENLCLHL